MSHTIDIAKLAIDISFARSSGPGGQNVNKVNSKAVLSYDLANCPHVPAAVKERLALLFPNRITQEGIIVLSTDSYRDQAANIKACYAKLEEMLTAASRRPKTRVATRPTRASKERRLEAKKSRANRKEGRRRVDY